MRIWLIAFEHAEAGFVVASEEGELLGANAAARSMLGIEPTDFGAPVRAMLARGRWRRESGEACEPSALPLWRDERGPYRGTKRGAERDTEQGEHQTLDIVRVLPGDRDADHPDTTHTREAGTRAEAGDALVLRLETWPAEGGFWLTLVLDLTDRAEAERLGNAVREELRRAGKLEAIARLSRGLAHDFRNVAAAIRAAAQRARGELDSGGDCGEAIEAIREASEHAIGLTRDLSAFAGGSPAHGRGVSAPAEDDLDLRDVVRGTVRLAQLAIAPNIRVLTTTPDEPVPIVGDAAQLAQVVMNLVLNGAQAMTLGGEVHVQLRVLPSERSAELRVRDQGSGMDHATLERATDPYFTTRGDRGGTGLGLSITLGILREHHGSLRFETAPERGTTAIVRLPIRSDDQRPARHTPRDERSPALEPGAAGEAVVIAPPSAMRGVLVGVLADFGLNAEAVDPAEAAGEPCGHAALRARLIVIDSLPDTTARQLRAATRTLGCNAPILTLLPQPTGDAQQKHGAPPDTETNVTVLRRPFTIADLREAIRDAMRQA
ncbi:MAG: hypothetical protein EA378_05950 [Phycisphaerales bacterium]|nr:MAG: hypothetical protein EA378_05950 [Phycisphaerales bacterium]